MLQGTLKSKETEEYKNTLGEGCGGKCLEDKIQDTNQFIGNLVGWIVIYIIHNTMQASNKTNKNCQKIPFKTIESSHIVMHSDTHIAWELIYV